MAYGDVYENEKGSLLMDLGVERRYAGESTRRMILLDIGSDDWIYGEHDRLSIRDINRSAFDPTSPNQYKPVP